MHRRSLLASKRLTAATNLVDWAVVSALRHSVAKHTSVLCVSVVGPSAYLVPRDIYTTNARYAQWNVHTCVLSITTLLP
jgi:hypothetical protein